VTAVAVRLSKRQQAVKDAALALGLDVMEEQITDTTTVVQVNGDTGKWLRIVGRGNTQNYVVAHTLACSLGHQTRTIAFKYYPDILKLLKTS
jgi:trans-2-enoyl-CoA reductase